MKLMTGALVAMLSGLAARDAQVPTHAFPLQGTWTLVAADKVLPDGHTTRDYGAHPKGRLVVDAKGRYSLQIFKSERGASPMTRPTAAPTSSSPPSWAAARTTAR